jgi:hypothetical protein
MMNQNLTEEEFDSLANKYATEDKMFDYASFVSNINLAFTTKGIDKNPIATVKAVTPDATFLARRKYLEMTEDEQDKLRWVLGEYKKAIAHRRLNLKPMFQDFDITKNGHCSKMQFLRVLA